MIELIPAIDIINGQCVRLTKGDYDQKTVYGKPLDMALECKIQTHPERCCLARDHVEHQPRCGLRWRHQDR